MAPLDQPTIMNTSNAIMRFNGLGLDFDLGNLTLAGFPENVTVDIKTPTTRLDMEEEIAYINLK